MTITIFISIPTGPSLHFTGDSIAKLKKYVETSTGIPQDAQKYHQGGKDVQTLDNIENLASLTLFLGLLGGKGGFGSLLKNQAQTRRKIINWDQSRDRDGRRIGNAKNELNLIEFFKTRQEEEVKIQKEVEQVKIMQATLKATQSNIKLDQKYKDQLEQNEQMISESMNTAKNRKIVKEIKKKEKVQKHILDLLDEHINDNAEGIVK